MPVTWQRACGNRGHGPAKTPALATSTTSVREGGREEKNCRGSGAGRRCLAVAVAAVEAGGAEAGCDSANARADDRADVGDVLLHRRLRHLHPKVLIIRY